MRGLFYGYGVSFLLAMIILIALSISRLVNEGVDSLNSWGSIGIASLLFTCISGAAYLLNTFALLGGDRKIDADRFDEVFDDREVKLEVNETLKVMGIIAIVSYVVLIVFGLSWILEAYRNPLITLFRYFIYLLMVGMVSYFYQTYDRVVYK